MMDDKCQLKCKATTLQNLAAIRIAATLWEADIVRAELMNPFCGKIVQKEGPPCSDCWKKVVEKILKNASALPLVATAMGDVEKNVSILGARKFYFIKHVLVKLRFEIKFINRMFWKCTGTIDEEKIIHEIWLKEFEHHAYKLCINNERRFVPMWFFASIHPQDDVIAKYEREIKNSVSIYYEVDVDNCVDKTYHLISLMLLINYKYEERSEYLQDFFLMIDEYLEVGDFTIRPDVMLELSAYMGHLNAVKYYWSKLNESEQMLCAVPYLLIRVCHRLLKNEFITHRLITTVEILAFFIKKMKIDDRKNYILENINILLELSSCIWPLQESSFFEMEWIDWETVHYNELIVSMHNLLRGRNSLVACGTYTDFLQQILEKIPKNQKQEIFIHSKIASGFCNTFGFAWIKLLLSDSDLKGCREQIIINGFLFYDKLFRKMQDKLLQHLFNIFVSNSDRKCFVKAINLAWILRFYGCSSYYFIDNLLDWLFSSETNKSILDVKNLTVSQIITDNSAKLCLKFTRHQKYDLADKFLKWQFNSEEAQKNFKKSVLSNHNDIIKEIYGIWSLPYSENGVQLATLKCSEFLLFYLDSEEEVIKYKKEKLNILENKMFIGKMFEGLGGFCCANVNIYDDLLAFLSVPNEKMIEVKDNMRSNIELWIYRCGRGRHYLGLAIFLINWLYPEEDEKEKLVKNYLYSEEGVSFVRDVIRDERSTSFDFVFGYCGGEDTCSVRKLFEEKFKSLKNK